MPDYIYALHDFQPENEDEVPFQAGERIEVVEKDDEFGDGWWQVSFMSTFRMAAARGIHDPTGVHARKPPIVP